MLDLLRGGSLLEVMNYQPKENAGRSHADGSVVPGREKSGKACRELRHVSDYTTWFSGWGNRKSTKTLPKTYPILAPEDPFFFGAKATR